MESVSIKEGDLLRGHSGTYQVGKRLGLEGATAKVFEVHDQESERRFALKLMRHGISSEMEDRFKMEISVLQRLSSKESKGGTHHIPRVVECSDLKETATQALFDRLGRPFILLTFAQGISVAALLKKNRLPEEKALEIAVQLARVLLIAHNAEIACTDLKIDDLIWDADKNHLTVIDWNVVSRGNVEQESEQDRMRAASFLYQMLTRIPLDAYKANSGTLQLRDQSYRRKEEFLDLSSGIKFFFLKAFHPDPESRQGGSQSGVVATQEFLDELRRHCARFGMATVDLLERGEEFFELNLWQDAEADLDIAARKASGEMDLTGDQYARLLELRESTQKQLKRTGRPAFSRGLGRFQHSLFSEAAVDFEKALKDDPYDEEARLYLIMNGLALRLDHSEFQPLIGPLKELISALLDGHLSLAESILQQVVHLRSGDELPELKSFKSEIEVRQALIQGQQLLKEDRLEEAEKCFRSAYQKSADILHLEALEEVLGDINEKYRQIECLKNHIQLGDSFLVQRKFREAQAEFWKAHALAPTSRAGWQGHQKASSYAEIQKWLASGDADRANEACRRTPAPFVADPLFEELERSAKSLLVDSLHLQAAHFRQRKDHRSERNWLEQILSISRNDIQARNRLVEIEGEIARASRDKLELLANRMTSEPSIKTCAELVREAERQGGESSEETRRLLHLAQGLQDRISAMSDLLSELGKEGRFQEQIEVLEQAMQENLTLLQGTPETLISQLYAHIPQEVSRLVRIGHAAEALALGRFFDASGLEKSVELKQRLEAAGRLADLQKEWAKVKRKLDHKRRPGPSLKSLQLTKQALVCQARIQELAPELVDSEPQAQSLWEEDLDRFLAEYRRMVGTALGSRALGKARQAFKEIREALTLRQSDAAGPPKNGFDWGDWSEEMSALLSWAGQQLPKLTTRSFLEVLSRVHPYIKDSQVKRALSRLKGPVEKSDYDFSVELDKLRRLADRSPFAEWLTAELGNILNERQIWIEMGRNFQQAQSLIRDQLPAERVNEFKPTLELSSEADQLLEKGHQMEHAEKSLDLRDELVRFAQCCSTVADGLSKAQPLLAKSPYVQQLRQLAARKKRQAAKLKADWVAEQSSHISELFEQLPTLGESYERGSSLLMKLEAAIKNLREVDHDSASRFAHSLEQEMKSSELSIAGSASGTGSLQRIFELQRRIVERFGARNEEQVEKWLEQFPDFREVFKEYRARHRNTCRHLRQLSQDPERRREELLKLRERFGLIPRIAWELEQLDQSEARCRLTKQIRELKNLAENMRLTSNHEKMERLVKEINQDALTDSDREQFVRIKSELQFRHILTQDIKVKHFKAYFNERKNCCSKLIEAMLWAIRNSFSEENLSLHGSIRTNMDRAMAELLEQGSVSLGALTRFREVCYLISQLHLVMFRRDRPAPLQSFAPTKDMSRTRTGFPKKVLKDRIADLWDLAWFRYFLGRGSGKKALARIRSLHRRDPDFPFQELVAHETMRWKRHLSPSLQILPLTRGGLLLSGAICLIALTALGGASWQLWTRTSAYLRTEEFSSSPHIVSARLTHGEMVTVDLSRSVDVRDQAIRLPVLAEPAKDRRIEYLAIERFEGAISPLGDEMRAKPISSSKGDQMYFVWAVDDPQRGGWLSKDLFESVTETIRSAKEEKKPRPEKIPTAPVVPEPPPVVEPRTEKPKFRKVKLLIKHDLYTNPGTTSKELGKIPQDEIMEFVSGTRKLSKTMWIQVRVTLPGDSQPTEGWVIACHKNRGLDIEFLDEIIDGSNEATFISDCEELSTGR